MENEITVIKAQIDQFKIVVDGLDNILSKEGFGFVNKMQVKTEILRGTVFILYKAGNEAGYRVGKDRLWNIAIRPEYRGMGLGRTLLLYHRPNIIRVKNNPIGHLSKLQRDSFSDPTPFYEAMGYKKMTEDYGRNFWAGGSKEFEGKKQKRKFSKHGKLKHISIYIDEESFLFSAKDMAKEI
jgi:GNAT superfamily N-acetyltransferase